jgi:putative transposase
MQPRKHPAHGVHDDFDRPTIVFVTVCTKHRRPWLATDENHCVLVDIWAKAEAWLVGRYVVMPDHLHMFAAPGKMELSLDRWIRFRKSQFTKRRLDPTQQWQTDHWDTRLRSSESYEAKWEYVRANPVRAGLVQAAEQWPYQGELNGLPW